MDFQTKNWWTQYPWDTSLVIKHKMLWIKTIHVPKGSSIH